MEKHTKETFNLDSLCIRIKQGDELALKSLLNDSRIQNMINYSVWRICQKNNIPSRELVSVAQSIIWERIYINYIPAEDKLKGDNLVIRFIDSFLYGKLLNYIRKLKKLNWSIEERGFVRKIEFLSLDTKHPDSNEPFWSALPSDFQYTDLDNEIIQSVVNDLVRHKKVSQFDMLCFLKYKVLGFSYEELYHNIKSEYKINIRKTQVVYNVEFINNLLMNILKRRISQ